MKSKTECWEKLERLYERFVAEFGEASADKIFKVIMKELGNDRITISFAYYSRKLRNRQIRKNFYGGNYKELAIRYDCSEMQIRRIVHSEED